MDLVVLNKQFFVHYIKQLLIFCQSGKAHMLSTVITWTVKTQELSVALLLGTVPQYHPHAFKLGNT